MDEQLNSDSNAWYANLDPVICDSCEWSFLFPKFYSPEKCPHCFKNTLSRFQENLANYPNLHPPELYIPFVVSETLVTQSLKNFSKSIPFSPQDLSIQNLVKRLHKTYLPVWLVDCRLRATWQAETGFDYEVVSHQDHFSGGKWISRQVKEGRIRWETRLGKLDCEYCNLQTAAMEEHLAMIQQLGRFSAENARLFAPEILHLGGLRLPNRSSKDAWNDAEIVLKSKAAEDCRKAASAGHIRSFDWLPEFLDQNWTLLLLPIFSTYYLDDSGTETPVYLNGQSGQVAGSRKPSMKRAKSLALVFFLASVAIFFLSLLSATAAFALPAFWVITIVGLIAAVGLGISSIFPLATVWWFNRNQHPVQI